MMNATLIQANREREERERNQIGYGVLPADVIGGHNTGYFPPAPPAPGGPMPQATLMPMQPPQQKSTIQRVAEAMMGNQAAGQFPTAPAAPGAPATPTLARPPVLPAPMSPGAANHSNMPSMTPGFPNMPKQWLFGAGGIFGQKSGGGLY